MRAARGSGPRPGSGSSARHPCALLLALGVLHAGHCVAQISTSGGLRAEPIDETLEPQVAGHGSISIGFLASMSNGLKVDNDFTAPSGTVHSHGLALDFDYNIADAWTAHIGIPYISNKYDGQSNHCPTTAAPGCAHRPALSPQHPESQFLDDGEYHSTWQNWSLGLAYQTTVHDYVITPSVTAYIPSHDYTFFANAAVGQDIWFLELAATLAHQFELSNLYYRIGYGYVFSERVLDTTVSHHKINLELGYFVNDHLSVRAFGIGRVGHGYAARILVPLTQGNTNEYWYHHDQISEHNYFGAGLGIDYEFSPLYTLTASGQRLVWGQTVFDFKYATEIRLTRKF